MWQRIVEGVILSKSVNILIEKVLVIVLAVIQILGMHQLHCNEFAAFLRIWKTLVEMTELKGEFL